MADPQSLMRLCDDTARAAQGALAWFRDFPGRVEAQRSVLEKEFRLAAVEARKLRAATERPVAVGVYGLSQAGKSYLISTLARPPGRELTAALDKPRGFLADINPESEKEATGLVTRFTMHAEIGPAGFPVRLRLLGETDLVKILANSWYRDALDAEAAGAVAVEDADRVLAAAEAEAATGRELGEIAPEDVWDLQNYFESEFRSFVSAQGFRGAFWDRVAGVLPRLPLARRVDVYALLWNRFAPFTELLRRLSECLRQLAFDRDAWAPIAALVPKTESVLKVDTLDQLIDAGGPRVEIQGKGGARCTLARAELTALIAELQITMTELPWPIFRDTDLLDFPGARERTGRSHATEIAATPRMLGEFFLRGKVAYLFERYAAERELNALLLCIRESNNPFDATIRQSIRNWIGRTHGEKPEDRARVETALFIVLTRMDMHFNRTPGRDDDTASSDLWEARVKASLLQPLQEAGGWLDAWHPGRPFDNTVLARNPGRSQSLSRLSSDGVEAEFLPGVEAKVARWGGEFAAHPEVRTYMRDPARAWQEVFRLNDAGMSYLIERLAPVCRPELKHAQLANQVGLLRAGMRRRLSEWHVGDDLDAEFEKRITALRPALAAVEAAGNGGRFGTLLSEFHFDPAEAREVLLRNLPRTEPSDAPGPTTAPSGRVSDLRAALRQNAAAAAQQGAKAAPAIALRDPAQDRAASLTTAWIAKLRRFSAEPIRRGYFGLDAAGADALVSELVATAVRTGLSARLADALRRMRGSLRFDQLAERRAVAAAQLINEQANFLGLSQGGVLARERPSIEGGPVVFEPMPEPEPGFELEETAPQFGDLFCLGWVDGLADAVNRNVRDRGAGVVDQRENDALGAVLALL